MLICQVYASVWLTVASENVSDQLFVELKLNKKMLSNKYHSSI